MGVVSGETTQTTLNGEVVTADGAAVTRIPVVVCGVVLVLSCVWCCSCCVFVFETCFSSHRACCCVCDLFLLLHRALGGGGVGRDETDDPQRPISYTEVDETHRRNTLMYMRRSEIDSKKTKTNLTDPLLLIIHSSLSTQSAGWEWYRERPSRRPSTAKWSRLTGRPQI